MRSATAVTALMHSGMSASSNKKMRRMTMPGLTANIIKEYDDPAYSGTRDDRPAFQLMLHEVEKLRPSYLILWKTDRLSRDRLDAVIAKKRLRECGVKIVYVAESIPDDDEATQILMESIYEAMAASFILFSRSRCAAGAFRSGDTGTDILQYCRPLSGR